MLPSSELTSGQVVGRCTLKVGDLVTFRYHKPGVSLADLPIRQGQVECKPWVSWQGNPLIHVQDDKGVKSFNLRQVEIIQNV